MPKKPPFHFDSPYQAWLVCLYNLMDKARREGLLAIEPFVERPLDEPGSPFLLVAPLKGPLYIEFATDLLRLMVSGHMEVADLTVYADSAMSTYCAPDHSAFPSPHLLRTIWLTLRAAAQGYPPLVACEFGRQAIPVPAKPSCAALEALLKAHQHLAQPAPTVTLASRASAFVSSLD